jgi:uncharacterized protein involved in exopolysaccharide biosynthesis
VADEGSGADVRSLAVKALVVVGITALAGIAAYGFSKQQARTYTAISQLGYGRSLTPELQSLGPAFAEPTIDAESMATEATRVKSFDVAIAAAKASPQLRLNAPQIAARTDVSQPHDTHTVVVTATGPTPFEAARLGNAYVDAYVATQRERQRRRADEVRRALEFRLSHISKRSALGPLGSTLRDEISLAGLIGRVQAGGPQVIERAHPAGAPSQPQTQRNVLFGLLFGLVAGIGLVALRSETRTRGSVAAARRVSGGE